MSVVRSGVAAYRKPSTGIPMSDLAAPGGWGELVSGRYYLTAGPVASGTSSALGVGTLRLTPWVIPNACTIDRIGADISSAGEAGSKVRLGIYADNGSAYPGDLVLDAGTVNGDSATVQEITISQALTAGLYWIGGAVQVVATTQPTVRILTGNGAIAAVPLGTSAPTASPIAHGYSNTGVTGAFPGTFTTTISGASIAPRIHVRVA